MPSALGPCSLCPCEPFIFSAFPGAIYCICAAHVDIDRHVRGGRRDAASVPEVLDERSVDAFIAAVPGMLVSSTGINEYMSFALHNPTSKNDW